MKCQGDDRIISALGIGNMGVRDLNPVQDNILVSAWRDKEKQVRDFGKDCWIPNRDLKPGPVGS